MTENKLVVVIMGQDCQRFISMCLDSVKGADAIVYLDGGSKDKTLEMVKGYKEKSNNNFTIMYNEYNQIDKMMNGKQRNIYLRYVKEKYPDYWCLALDADEVVENLLSIKKFINSNVEGLFSVKMRHFIGDLGHEDSKIPEHFVPNRLFKIGVSDKYPEVEHPVLIPKQGTQTYATRCTAIWHLGHAPNLEAFMTRYHSNLAKSDMHTEDFLKQWYMSHMFGQYPRSRVHLLDIPNIILNHYDIDRDEIYFSLNRDLQVKHFIDAIHWKDFFKCKTAIELGCGMGMRIYATNKVGIDTDGIEISQFACKKGLATERIKQGDVTKIKLGKKYDLIIAYDLLEHLKYEDLDKVIKLMIEHSNKHLLISVPVIGDPNLEADQTHIIKETKDWWIKQFSDKGCKLVSTPDHFLFREQVLIFEVPK